MNDFQKKSGKSVVMRRECSADHPQRVESNEFRVATAPPPASRRIAARGDPEFEKL
ncbi:MAG: hypothetical protein VB143_04900 [Burkholderia sp.]